MRYSVNLNKGYGWTLAEMKSCGVSLRANHFTNLGKWAFWLEPSMGDPKFAIAEIAPMLGIMKTTEEILDDYGHYKSQEWINPRNIIFTSQILIDDKRIKYLQNYGTPGYYQAILRFILKRDVDIKGIVSVKWYINDRVQSPLVINGLILSIGSLEREVINEEIERWRRYLVDTTNMKKLEKIEWEIIEPSEVVYLC